MPVSDLCEELVVDMLHYAGLLVELPVVLAVQFHPASRSRWYQDLTHEVALNAQPALDAGSRIPTRQEDWHP